MMMILIDNDDKDDDDGDDDYMMMMVVLVKDRLQKVRDIEQQVWSSELADVHRVVDEELRAIRHMTAELFPTSEHQCNGLDTQQADNAYSDDDFDIDAMKLNLGNDEDSVCSLLPELYLAQSPVVDGGQSLSWYVAVVFTAFSTHTHTTTVTSSSSQVLCNNHFSDLPL